MTQVCLPVMRNAIEKKGGMQDGEPYLGFVNLQGTAFSDDVMATGMGTDLCLPVMRNAIEKKGGILTFEEAKATIEQCIRLCYLRDCRAWPRFHLANVSAEGCNVEGPMMIESDWKYAETVKGHE